MDLDGPMATGLSTTPPLPEWAERPQDWPALKAILLTFAEPSSGEAFSVTTTATCPTRWTTPAGGSCTPPATYGKPDPPPATGATTARETSTEAATAERARPRVPSPGTAP